MTSPVGSSAGSNEQDIIDYPKIRHIEAFPVDQDGQQMIAIRDPFNVAQNALVLPPPVFYLLTLMEGDLSVREIQQEFSAKFQQVIPDDTLQNILRQLDSELYLDTPNFTARFEEIQQAFLDNPLRPPAHAGSAYESQPDAFKKQLEAYIESVCDEPAEDVIPENGSVRFLISPHIDLRRGGPCFAHAYREIKKRPPSDLYVILGTGHQLRGSLLTCTKKHYDTPLGPVETDIDFVEEFSRRSPLNLFAEEFAHKDEHSVEFQAIFLKYILGEEWKGKIVPVLCGSFYRHIQNGTSPRTNPDLAKSLDHLRAMIRDYPGTVTVIAGVDMSHVGRRFGHEDGVPPAERARVTNDDRDVIEAMKTGNAETFFNTIERVKDCNNVCGLSPVYMCLDITRPKQGCLLNYDQAMEGNEDSIVTFASLAYYDE